MKLHSEIKVDGCEKESLFGQLYYLKILKSSSISESPGNSARWFTISANIQPTDHTSTGVE